MAEIIVSRWEKEGYQNNANTVYEKLSEIREACATHNLSEPKLELNITSYGEEYVIIADRKVTDFVQPVYHNDFEER